MYHYQNKAVINLILTFRLKKQTMKSIIFFIKYAFITLLFYPLMIIAYDTTQYEVNPSSISYEDMKLSFTENENDLVASVIKACSNLLSDTEIKDTLYKNIVSPMIVIPMPGNIRKNFLESTINIALLISGSDKSSSRLFPQTQKMICLNHLAYAYARGVSAYRFLHAEIFEDQLVDLPENWLKVIAMKTLLPQIEPDKWIMWIDDDVITSDFHTKGAPFIDKLINSYAKDGLSKAPSILVSSAPSTGLSTAIVLVRNSEEGRDFLQHWWDLRMDNINHNNFYYSNKTEKYYDDINLCLNTFHGDGGYGCYTKNHQGSASYDRKSLLDAQETLQHILFRFRTENIKTAKTAEFYTGSHIVKIFSQKHPVIQTSEIGYVGINTFIGDTPITEEARATHPDKDVWVHTAGMVNRPDAKNLYILSWLASVSDFYPYKKKGLRWQKDFHQIIIDGFTDSGMPSLIEKGSYPQNDETDF